MRNRIRPGRWVAAGLLAAGGWACSALTGPDARLIEISFQTDTTVVVGRTFVPSIGVAVDGAPAPNPRLVLESSNPDVVQVVGDSLRVLSRGTATLKITLVGSTVGDPPPDTTQILHAVADQVVITNPPVLLQSFFDTVSLRAVPLGATGDTLAPTPALWSSTNPAVATVEPSGRVTAIGNGQAELLAVIDRDTGRVAITVTQALARYALAPTPVIIGSLNGTRQVTATPLDSGGSVVTDNLAPLPQFESATSAVATVSTSGLVTGVTNGQTYVRASGGGVLDSVRVEVRQVAAKVEIFGPAAITLEAVADTTRLFATAFDSLDTDVRNSNPLWTSSNLNVIQVEPQTGIVRALAVGSAFVVARVDNAVDTVAVTVTNLPRSIAIVQDTLSFSSINDTTPATAVVRNKLGAALTVAPTWRTIDSTIATALPDGRVVAKAIGTTRLIATVDATVADTIPVVVTNLPETVNLIPLDATLASINDTLIPAVEIKNARGAALARTSVSWSVDDIAVATVTAGGIVVARGRGQAYVYAVNPLNAAKRDSLLLTVTNAPASITLNRSIDTLTAPSRTLLYEAVIRNARGAIIAGDVPTWSTQNPNVATISSAGLLTAQAVGTTNVIAEIGAGPSLRADTARITVLNTAVSLTVSPVQAIIPSVGATLQLGAVARNDVGGEVTNVTFLWNSSDPNVATVSPAGLVSAVAVGRVNVSVSLGSLVANADIEVTNAPDTVQIVPTNLTLASVLDSVEPQARLVNALGVLLDRASAQWLSDDAGIASVTATGVIIAISRGTTTIRARNPLNISRTDAVTVTVTNAPDSIDLNRTNDTLPSLNRTLQYQATVWNKRRNTIPGEPVSWTSSNTAVATVTADGLARSVGIGQTYIRGAAGGVRDSALLVVRNSPASLIVTPSPIALASVGATQQLSATALNELGNVIGNAIFSYSSTNAGVASVNSSGLVTAISTGSAAIVVSAKSPGATDSVTTTIAASVSNFPTTVELNPPDSIELASIGDTYVVPTNFSNAGGPLGPDAALWSSTNSAIASVTSSGTVSAVARGTVYVVARSPADATKRDSIKVYVSNKPNTVTLNQTTVNLTAIDATFGLIATVRNTAGAVITDATVTWSSSDPGKVSVSPSGVLTAEAIGSAAVTATAATAVTANANVTVTNNAVSIAIAPPTAQILDLGGTTSLSAVALNNRGEALPGSDITWTPLDPGIATVSTAGLVTASLTTTGTAKIRALAPGGVADTAFVTVLNAPRTISFPAPKLDTLEAVGQTASPTVTILNAGAAALPRTDVTWSSTATQVATVSSGGVVTAQGIGETFIKAASPYEPLALLDSIKIVVTNAPASIEMSTDSVSITALLNTFAFTAIVKNASNNALPGEVVLWESRNTAIATVSNAGVATAQGVGTTWIVTTVQSKPAIKDSAKVVVSNAATTVNVEPSTGSFTSVGSSQNFRAIALNSRGDTIQSPFVVWRVPVGATVISIDTAFHDAQIPVTSQTIGSATLRARVDQVTRDVAITVADNLDSILFDQDALTIPSLGLQATVTGTFLNAQNLPVPPSTATWSSDNSAIASVTGNGIVTGVAVGVTKIRAVSPTDPTAKDSITVTVTNDPAVVTLNSTSDSLTAAAQVLVYSASVKNAQNQNIPGATVAWTARTPGVVAISPTGDLTADISSQNFGSTWVVAEPPTGTAKDSTFIVVYNPTEVYVNKASTKAQEHGTRKYPFKTIASGIGFADPSDVVVIIPAAGGYTEAVNITKQTSLQGDTLTAGCTGLTCATPANLPALVMNNPGVPAIRGTAAVPVSVRHLVVNQNAAGAAIDLQNATAAIEFVYVNPAASGGAAGAQGSGILLVNPASGSSVKRSVVKRVNHYGIRIDGGANATVEGAFVTGVGQLAGDSTATGIEIKGGTGNVVRADTVTRTVGARVLVRATTDAIVARNRLLGRARLLQLSQVTGTSRADSNTFVMDAQPDDPAATHAVGMSQSTVPMRGNVFSESGQTMDALYVADGSSSNVTRMQVNGGRYGIEATGGTVNTVDGVFANVTSAFRIGTGATFTSTSDTVLSAIGPCLRADSSNSSVTVTSSRFAACATDAAATAEDDAIFVDGTNTDFTLATASFGTMDRRLVHVKKADAVSLTGNVLTGPTGGAAVTATYAAAYIESANTVSATQNVIQGFTERVGLYVAGDPTTTVTNNQFTRNLVGLRTDPGLTTYTITGNDVWDNVSLGALGLPADNAVLPNWWGDGKGPRRYPNSGMTPDSAVGDSVTFAGVFAPNYGTVTSAASAGVLNINAAEVDSLLKLRGDLQSAAAGGTLARVLAVRALDANGRPVQGVSVRFVSSDTGDDFDLNTGGSQDDRTVVTDGSGIARVPLKFDNTAGQRTITVTVASPSLTTTFTVTAN